MLAAQSLGESDHAQAGGARGDLGMALCLLDQPLRPRLDLASCSVPAMIQVAGGKVGVIGEHDADAVDTFRGKSVLVRSPRPGVGYRGIPAAAARHDGRFGSLALSGFP